MQLHLRYFPLNNCCSLLFWRIWRSEETVLFLSHKSHCLTIILLSLCVIYPKCKINRDVKCQGRPTGLTRHLTSWCFPSSPGAGFIPSFFVGRWRGRGRKRLNTCIVSQRPHPTPMLPSTGMANIHKPGCTEFIESNLLWNETFNISNCNHTHLQNTITCLHTFLSL